MCIIAVNRFEGQEITETEFKEMFKRNSHGFGMMWVDMNGIQVFKTKTMNDAYDKYKEVFAKRISDIVLHFRIATQGYSIDNLHPFEVTENLWMAHNGVITQWSGKNFVGTGKSDTRLFVENVLQDIDDIDTHIHSDWLRLLIEEYIVTDKLAFLTSEGNAIIFNKSKGEEHNGNWFSNGSYKPYISTTQSSYSRYTECVCCGRVVVTPKDYIILSHNAKSARVCTSCLPYLDLEDILGEVNLDINELEGKYPFTGTKIK